MKIAYQTKAAAIFTRGYPELLKTIVSIQIHVDT